MLEASGKEGDQAQAGEIRARVLALALEEGVLRDLMTSLLNELADRKRTLFPDDRRVIAGVDVQREGDRFNVQALSAFT